MLLYVATKLIAEAETGPGSRSFEMAESSEVEVSIVVLINISYNSVEVF